MNFFVPNKQAPIGIVVNFVYGLQKLVRAFFPLLILMLLRVTKGEWTLIIPWIVLSILAFFVVVLLIAYLNYRNFTFHIEKETESFVVQKGIFNKTKSTIKLAKIQQVNINQTFINKLLGIYSIEVDSAGSVAKEGIIKSVSHEVAQALKQTLLTYKENVIQSTESTNNPSVEHPTVSPRDVRHISIGTLLKVGATTNYLYTMGIVLLFANSLVYEGSKFFEDSLDDEAIDAFLEERVTLYVGLVVMLFFLAAIFVANIIRTVVKFYNYKMVVQHQRLFLSYGLLQTKSTIIKPSRVQLVKIVRNYFQKLWGIAGFKIHQVFGKESLNQKTALEIPGCSNEETKEFFEMIFNKPLELEGTTLKHNYRYFGFRFFLLACIPVVLFLLFISDAVEDTWKFSSAATYFAIVTLLIWRSFKIGRLIITPNFIVVKSGVWDITHTIVEPHKIQKIVLSQLWWQKSANVGSLTLFTAGGMVSFNTSDYNQLKQLKDQWLYEIESKNKAWM
ncbi:PH domain-containing protein [Myroides sp. DF42-4-2]|uniref:PH domain-containing protein n=1 Tax=unclassified Myroides TaxID=2642485 RepID=UPI0025767C5A|nr:PH domain-containing protein [Myroides sp. DF42-4-2]MDM1408020.1 PH domain-containing protein [Myroides sp. DF42-4-2]